MQGYYSSNGNQKALIGFPTAMFADTQGATIEKVELFLYAQQWYYNAGGTMVLGTHDQILEPASFVTGPAPNGVDRQRYPNWPKPGGLWLDVTWFNAGIQNGTIRGVVLGPGPSNDFEFYGRFSGASEVNPPTIRVTYTK